ncbi:hypothetical protein MVEN_00205000 [Mycena venus]|uniref:Uncharacterized protein n=1 Tax=Mycena venus TaxID=2733690 RepID=A0A8H7DAY4_9AGAR|nr:hypothetical protein MVEN_00205000 [Mycena venus]
MSSTNSDDEDHLQTRTNGCMPTVEVNLRALELEFDKQLESVMDNLFGDEYASLYDLEPIETTITPLVDVTIANNVTNATLSTGVAHLRAPTVINHSLDDRSTTNTYTAAKNARNSVANGSIHMGTSGSHSSGHDNAVTIRSTRMPAPPIVQSDYGPAKLALRTTSSTREDSTIVRSTKIGTPSAPQCSIHSKPVVNSETVTRPTNSAEVRSRTETAPLTSGVGVFAEAVPNIANAHGRGALDSSADFTAPKFSSLPQPHATPSFSQFHHFSSHSTQPTATKTFENSSTGVINEDIEMSSSELCLPLSEILRGVPGGSLQAAHNQTLVMHEIRRQPNASPFSWVSGDQTRSNAALFSFSASGYVAQASMLPSYSMSQPATISPAQLAPDSNHTHLGPSSPPLPQPSIFELLHNEPPHPMTFPRPGAYIVPPVTVPDRVWQEEIARERLRHSENSPKPSKRSRLFSPYFLRTPLVMKNAHRNKKSRTNRFSSHTSNGRLDYDDSQDKTPPWMSSRASSPAFSCSSEVSSTSSGSSSSTSTYSYERKLSSPPPFRERLQRFTAPIEEYRGVFGALRSMSWLWSRQA